ncbi:MAG: hypothetical protein KGI11_08190 [Thaumarchaeota archaeon]|nr:hypothetical protein [Nitrososphaerota archaeon]
MNRGKQGRRFLFPESFMKLVGYAKTDFGLPYRQTEGLLRIYGDTIPRYKTIPQCTRGSTNWMSRQTRILVTTIL